MNEVQELNEKMIRWIDDNLDSRIAEMPTRVVQTWQQLRTEYPHMYYSLLMYGFIQYQRKRNRRIHFTNREIANFQQLFSKRIDIASSENSLSVGECSAFGSD